MNNSSESEIISNPDAASQNAAAFSDPVLISKGTYSSIWRVSRSGKYFLVKAPSPGSGEADAMVRREYDLSLGLSHPNIATIFTFEESTPVGPGIVMEYVDGRNLGAFLAEKPSLRERKRIFSQLLEAVSYVHRNGRLHNDLKPSNILITHKDNDLKLIDFGLSDDDAHFLTQAMGGTPSYASPELLRQEKPLDVRSDIYSVGLLMRDILGNKYRRISRRCLNYDRADRYGNVEQIQTAVRRYWTPMYISLAAIFIAALALSGIYLRQTLSRQSLTIEAYKDSLAVLHHSQDSIRSLQESLLRDKSQADAAAAAKIRQRDSLFAVIDAIMAKAYKESQRNTPQDRLNDFSDRVNKMFPELEKWRKSYDPELAMLLDNRWSLRAQEYMGTIIKEH